MKLNSFLFSILFLFPLLSYCQQIQVDTFYFTGSTQNLTVTALMISGPIVFDIRGGQGGNLVNTAGGDGGRVVCEISLNVGDQLDINVGGAGVSDANLSGGVFVGSGGVTSFGIGVGGDAGTGGGASDIRLNGSALTDRIIVAGGGGGAGGNSNSPVTGGAGGDLIGADGSPNTAWPNSNGKGGSQTVGGTSGVGVSFCSNATSGLIGVGGQGAGDGIGGGGGGGGYYGGGGSCTSGGGGGSSYTDPMATNIVHTQGFQNGNGMVIISYNSCFTPNQAITACDSLVSPSGNYTWTTSGMQFDTISSLLGCIDTLLALNLTIVNSVEAIVHLDACSFYIWPENGGVYTNSGLYSVILQSTEGCDSTITLDLNIITPLLVVDSVEVCETYTWPVDGQVYNSSTNVSITSGGTSGCDTTYNLILEVNNSTSDTETISACNSYTWPVTGMTYTSSIQISENLTTVGGCDSIRILDLTINSVDASVTDLGNYSLSANAVGVNYQWLECNNNYAIIVADTIQAFNVPGAGSYAVEVTGNGCVDTSDCFTYTLSIQDNNISSVEIYPNPTNQTVNVDLGQKYKSINIRISDISGKIIQSYQFDNKQFLKLNIEGEAGLYFIEITSKSGLKSTTIIVKE